MLNHKTNSHRSEANASEQTQDLQSCCRAAGLPHTVTVSPTLAARCGWLAASPPGVDRYDIAWLVRLTLTGYWPHRRRQTKLGEVLLLEFPTFPNAREAINLQLGIVVGGNQKLDLVDPAELDEPAPKRACVLAAEDDPELARLICALLERAGFTVTHAADGIEAWRLVQNQHFDVVVLDIDMPGLTGIEVCQRIKTTPVLAHLPVVLCSGRLDLPELVKQAGADGFVEKPSGLFQLADHLKYLLGPPGLRQQPGETK